MEKMIQKHKILRDAWNQLDEIFVGVAIPCEKSTAGGDTVKSEKVLKFAKMSRKKRGQINERLPSTMGDNASHMAGTPGSRARLEAYAAHYDNKVEASPFLPPSRQGEPPGLLPDSRRGQASHFF